MGSKKDLFLIDTNIFVIDLRYKRDTHFSENRAFLDMMAQTGTGFTTVLNLLELCGILSFNLNATQLTELWHYFQEQYRITVFPSLSLEDNFPPVRVGELFAQIRKKSALGDAMMLAIMEKHLNFITTLVTWDKTHFENKFPGAVVTPANVLQDQFNHTGPSG